MVKNLLSERADFKYIREFIVDMLLLDAVHVSEVSYAMPIHALNKMRSVTKTLSLIYELQNRYHEGSSFDI